MCHQERLVLISNTTGLSFAEERIGPLSAIIIIVFIYSHFIYLHYQKPLKIRLLSIYREFLLQATRQHLLLLVGFDTLIY